MKKQATIYRMVTPRHICPWGIKAYDLLKRNGHEVTDRHIQSKDANKAYKEKNKVDETPQIFIEGERIGSYDQLREHLGLGPDPKEGETYQPVLAVFAVTFLMAITTTLAMGRGLHLIPILELFIAFSMCVLGILKLQDLMSFATGFVQYDLIAQRYVSYAYIYPFVEAGAGILMIASLFTWVAAPATLVVSTVGAISVFKAVYVEKRELSCACIGGGSDVPLGFISLTENIMMIAMSIWMLVKL